MEEKGRQVPTKAQDVHELIKIRLGCTNKYLFIWIL